VAARCRLEPLQQRDRRDVVLVLGLRADALEFELVGDAEVFGEI
jgi:hypothetical protein